MDSVVKSFRSTVGLGLLQAQLLRRRLGLAVYRLAVGDSYTIARAWLCMTGACVCQANS